jgi:hypothetical protein
MYLETDAVYNFRAMFPQLLIRPTIRQREVCSRMMIEQGGYNG